MYFNMHFMEHFQAYAKQAYFVMSSTMDSYNITYKQSFNLSKFNTYKNVQLYYNYNSAKKKRNKLPSNRVTQ